MYVCASLWGEYMGTYLLAVGTYLDGEGRGDEREDGLRVIIVGMHKHTSTVSRSRVMSVSVVLVASQLLQQWRMSRRKARR